MFVAEALPQIPLGELTTLPRPLSWIEGGASWQRERERKREEGREEGKEENEGKIKDRTPQNKFLVTALKKNTV